MSRFNFIASVVFVTAVAPSYIHASVVHQIARGVLSSYAAAGAYNILPYEEATGVSGYSVAHSMIQGVEHGRVQQESRKAGAFLITSFVWTWFFGSALSHKQNETTHGSALAAFVATVGWVPISYFWHEMFKQDTAKRKIASACGLITSLAATGYGINATRGL